VGVLPCVRQRLTQPPARALHVACYPVMALAAIMPTQSQCRIIQIVSTHNPLSTSHLARFGVIRQTTPLHIVCLTVSLCLMCLIKGKNGGDPLIGCLPGLFLGRELGLL